MSCNLTFYFLSRKRNCEYSTLQHRVKKKLGMKCFNYEDNVDVAVSQEYYNQKLQFPCLKQNHVSISKQCLLFIENSNYMLQNLSISPTIYHASNECKHHAK